MPLVSFSKKALDEYLDISSDYANEGLTVSYDESKSNSSQNQAIETEE